ncbi:MAG: alpha/beta hydrolase [Bacteroidales bacterium]|jgi:acetyl esterase/lipase|nr:alpha/beta hydrolase [Bacteroidales bacterium]MDD4703722.1 alpha/beta hydrolase [Bacteroidales bacterium]MDX9798067.1 alpha/beta hydrolase [Bacteroidales bacterium]
MKRLILFFISILIISSNLLAKGDKIKLWVGVENKELAKQTRPELIPYFPNDSLRNGTCVIICPGGSYNHLAMKTEGYEVAKWFRSIGVTAFVLRYRVAFRGNHHPSMIEDIQRAIQIIRENSNKYGINPDKLGLIGFSAGGHLVTMAGAFSKESFLEKKGIKTDISLRPDFIIPVYPVVSMQDSIAHKKSRKSLVGKNNSIELLDKLSLEKQIPKDMPMVFLLTAKDDEVVDYRNSVVLKEALIKQNIPCKFVLLEKGGHGFGMFKTKSEETKNWNLILKTWLKENHFL